MLGRNDSLYGRVFSWDSMPKEEVRKGVRRCAFSTVDCMLVMNYIDPEMTPNPHVHDDFDQLVYISSGRARYHVSGTSYELGPGSMLVVPAGAEHYIEPLGGAVENLDVFTPPRADFAHLLSYLSAAPGVPPPSGDHA